MFTMPNGIRRVHAKLAITVLIKHKLAMTVLNRPLTIPSVLLLLSPILVV